MARQIEDIVLRLKNEGFENLDKIKGSFRELNKVTGFTETEIARLRKEVLDFDKGVGKSTQTLRGQTDALKALQTQAVINSTLYKQLGNDLKSLGGAYKEAATGAKAFTDAQLKSQFVGSKPATFEPQIAALKRDLRELSVYSRQYTETLTEIQRRQIPFNAALGRQNIIASFEAYQQGGKGGGQGLPALPNTNAALSQSIQEVTDKFANLERGTRDWRKAANELKRLSREAADGFQFMSAGAIEAKTRLDALRTSLKQVGGGFAEFSRNPLQFTQTAADRAAIQKSIERNRRKRGLLGAQVSDTPFGPAEPTELFRNIAGIQGQQVTNQLLGRSYTDVAASIRQVSASSDGSLNSLRAQRTAWESLRNALGDNKVALREVDKEIGQLDRRIEKRSLGRGKLTGMQLAQGVGAALSGGIFGGPEGLIGGLGGLAVGGVGGAFAGAAFGAQLAGLRQAGAAAATYAAEVRRLQLALQGIVSTFDDYKAALAAVDSASRTYNVPVREATQQFTKLSAAVLGSGGTIKDAENTFKGLTASVLATGGSVQDINGALVAAAQVFSKGKVTAEELRGQIGERLAGAFALFAESSNRSTKGLDAALNNGEVTIADFVKFTEFSLAKYGRTAQIIAASPEQAGARLDNALKALQKNVGDSLGPAGASFQDFATRAVNGLDKVINKLVELKAIQPGAGYYVQQVLSGALTIPDLEQQVARAGARESALRQDASSAGLGFIANLLPDISAATKEARILEEALIKVRLIEKETNKDRKQRQTEEADALKEKLGASYLQAFEQREEAIAQARIQREEQIADIRKQALEQARQLERQFADERRALERDIAKSKRGTADIEEDIARQRRLLAGEDPRIVEAEQRIVDVYREARDRDIDIKQQYADREFNRARTLSDFQKKTADDINKANETYAKSLGKIHREYARDVSKILDEASGKTAKRLAKAGQVLAAISELQALQMTRVRSGQTPVPADVDMPIQYRQQLDKINTLNKELLQSRRQAPSTADRFFAAYADQPQFEDVAGIQPLPIARMQRQAARPLRLRQQRYPERTTVNTTFNSSVLQRIERMQQVVDDWDPIGSQWKEIQNNLREIKRSRPAASVPAAVLADIARRMWSDMLPAVRKSGGLDTKGTTGRLGSQRDFSEYLNDKQLRVLQQGLRSTLEPAYVSQFGINKQPEALTRAVGLLAPMFRDFRRALVTLLEQEAAQGRVYAEKTLQKLGVNNAKASRAPDPDTIEQRFNRLFNQPNIVPGVGKDFEGAMLPGGDFNTGKLTRSLGNVATRQLQGVLTQVTDQLIAAVSYRVGDTIGAKAQRTSAQPIRVVPATKGADKASEDARAAAAANSAAQLQRELLVISYEALAPLKEQNTRLQEQNDLFQAQQRYIKQGITPALAEQYAQIDQIGELNRRIAARQVATAIDKALTDGANNETVLQLVRNHRDLTASIDSNVNSAKNLASAYQDAQKAARFTQDARIGLGLREGAEQYIQSIGTMREATAQLAQTGIKGVEDAIFSLVTTGTANFREFAASILRDTSRMIIQQLILRSVMQIIGAIGGGPSAIVPGKAFDPKTIPGMAFAKGGAFAANGIVPFAMGGIVNKPTLFKFADGGAGRLGLMGEAGPEAIMPLRRLPNGRLGVEQAAGGTAPVSVTVNVDANGTSVQGNAGQGEQLGRAISQAVQAELVRQQRPGGLLSR